MEIPKEASAPWPRRRATDDKALIDGLVNSQSRLAAVKSTGLLDSPADEAFDLLTRLAARLVNVPASFVSIVDASRDFYKSQSGFPAPLANTRELTGRTFCHFTLDNSSPLIIDDTHSNEVWKSVPTVESLGVRAYVGVPIKVNGEIVGSFCVIDVKPREWNAEELETIRQLAISAGREINLRLALEMARNEAANSQMLARTREEILAVVAHDLRTPLQILQLSTQILQKTLAAEHAATADRMSRAIDAMTQMTDGLLSNSALLAPSATGRKTISVTTLLGEAVDMMRPMAERSDISLALGTVADAGIHVDFGQMLRVLGNLIGNAVKYSSAGGMVRVDGRRDDKRFVISVEDNGKGMNPDEQARAYEKGWQGAAGMVRGDGAGLGLSIAKTLVVEHGGTMELASEVGVGTSVTIALPIKQVPAAA
jgi:signal transduction histidine kinase